MKLYAMLYATKRYKMKMNATKFIVQNLTPSEETTLWLFTSGGGPSGCLLVGGGPSGCLLVGGGPSGCLLMGGGPSGCLLVEGYLLWLFTEVASTLWLFTTRIGR